MADFVLQTEVLHAYVPQHIVKRVSESPMAPAGATMEKMVGATMLADISGFTPLTERLSKSPEGAETLTRILNEYFGIMIGIIEEHGGDVIKFAGDAVIVVFLPATDDAAATADDGGEDGGAADGSLHTPSSPGHSGARRLSTNPAALGMTPDGLHTKSSVGLLGGGVTDVDEFLDVDAALGDEDHYDPDLDFHDDDAEDLENFDDVLSVVAMRAAQCGRDLQEQLRDFLTEEGLPLYLHSTISIGRIYGLHVGGFGGRWDYLVTGRTLEEIEVLERYSEPGTLIVSGLMWRYIKRHAQAKELAGNVFLLEDLTPTEPRVPLALAAVPSEAAQVLEMNNALRSYISQLVLSMADAGQTDWLGEFRMVSVLFVKLQGLQPEYNMRLTSTVHSALTVMQTTLHDLGGIMLQFRTDEKGTLMIAAYGLPQASHEDDAVRAVMTALTIRRQLALKLKLQCGIGVTRGRAFCGSYGSEGRRDYSMMGDIVNLSARLMSKSKDTILCDERTYEACKAKFMFDDHEPIAIKGMEKKAALYTPISEIAATTSRRPRSFKDVTLVGRTMEMRIIEEQIAMLIKHAGHTAGPDKFRSVLVIEGDAGIGKSQLIAGLQQTADRRKVTVYATTSDPVNKSPYYTFRDVFLQLFRLNPDVDPVFQRDAILRYLQWDFTLHQFAPLLRDIFGFEIDDTPFTEPLLPEERREMLQNFAFKLCQDSVLRRPTVFIIEDYQHMDTASWAFLRILAEHMDSALIVVSGRPIPDDDARPAEYEEIMAMECTLRISLSSMAATDAASIAAQALGVKALPTVVRTLIEEKSGGNPMFCEELILEMRDRGLIVVEEGNCYVAPDVTFEDVHTPTTLVQVITGRIDQLSPSLELLVKVASVIGARIPYDLLYHIYPIKKDKDQLVAYMDELCELDILVLVSKSPRTYTFKYSLSRDVAYELLLFNQRRALHRTVALWYEDQYPPEARSAQYTNLAHHWYMANSYRKALLYYEKAAEHAAVAFSHSETIRYMTLVFALEEDAIKEDPSALAHQNSTSSRSGSSLNLLAEVDMDVVEIDPEVLNFSWSDEHRAHLHFVLAQAYFRAGILNEALDHAVLAMDGYQHNVPQSSPLKAIVAAVRHIASRLFRPALTIDEAAPNRDFHAPPRLESMPVIQMQTGGIEDLTLPQNVAAAELEDDYRAMDDTRTSELIELYEMVGSLARNACDRSLWAYCHLEAVRLSEKADHKGGMTRAYSQLGLNCIDIKQHGLGLTFLNDADVLVRKLNHDMNSSPALQSKLSKTTSPAYVNMGWQCVGSAMYDKAHEYFNLANASSHLSRDLRSSLMAAIGNGFLHELHGDLGKAADVYSDVQESAEADGDGMLRSWSVLASLQVILSRPTLSTHDARLDRLALVEVLMSDLKQGPELVLGGNGEDDVPPPMVRKDAGAGKLGSQSKSAAGSSKSMRTTSSSSVAARRSASGSVAKTASIRVKNSLYSNEMLWARGLLAFLHMLNGDADRAYNEARKFARYVHEVAPTNVLVFGGFQGALLVTLTLLEERAADEVFFKGARKLAKTLLSALQQFAQRFTCARSLSLRCHGLYMKATGRPGQARDSLRRSIDFAKRLGMRLEHARSLWYLGKLAKNQQLIDEANSMISSLNAIEHPWRVLPPVPPLVETVLVSPIGPLMA